MILDTEAAVIANFEFLRHTDMDMEEEEGDVEDEIYDANTDTKPNKVINYCYFISLFYIISFRDMFICNMCFINMTCFYLTGIYSSSSGGC